MWRIGTCAGRPRARSRPNAEDVRSDLLPEVVRRSTAFWESRVEHIATRICRPMIVSAAWWRRVTSIMTSDACLRNLYLLSLCAFLAPRTPLVAQRF